MQKLLCAIIIAFLFFPSNNLKSNDKHRLIVLTDIENEPDDTQSLVRLLLYSNVIDIEGMIATTSVWKKTNPEPESIVKVIKAYGKVWPNLIKHEKGFPEEKELLSKVKRGNDCYGMQCVGDGKDSEGAEWIIKMLERNDSRPLWVSVWGGANTLAQALYKLRKTKTEPELKRLIAKLRVYTISDQDDSGYWIRENFPDLFYIVTPGDNYNCATWTAINSVIDGIDNTTISNEWIVENIQQGHGSLGALYPDVAYGMEGDTPSFLSLIPNGLNYPEKPDWGGWGGRYEWYKPDFDSTQKGVSGLVLRPETRAIWTNAVDCYTPYLHNAFGRTVKQHQKTYCDNKVTLWRWRDDFQNDFAARMDWCIKSYNEANHPPIPILSHPENITVQSGEYFTLDASASYDPDGDNLSFLWFNYPEASTYKKLVKIESAENAYRVYIKAPEVDKKETIQFILKVTDKGNPPLTRYKRIFVNVEP